MCSNIPLFFISGQALLQALKFVEDCFLKKKKASVAAKEAVQTEFFAKMQAQGHAVDALTSQSVATFLCLNVLELMIQEAFPGRNVATNSDVRATSDEIVPVSEHDIVYYIGVFTVFKLKQQALRLKEAK